MATTTDKNKPAPVPAPTANGPKPAEPLRTVPAATGDASGAAPAPAAATEDGEEKTRGAIPQMPLCVIWRDKATKRVTAALLHPRGGEYKVEGKGIGGTTGVLTDEGYPTGAIRVDGPKWAEKRIPPNVEVLGYANVLGFPLPGSQLD